MSIVIDKIINTFKIAIIQICGLILINYLNELFSFENLDFKSKRYVLYIIKTVFWILKTIVTN